MRKNRMPPALRRYWANRRHSKRRKRTNPQARHVVLYAQRPGGQPLKWTGRKFARTGRAVLFGNRASAVTVARILRLMYPILKKYRFTVK